MVIVVHLDLDLASSFAARKESFLLFDASAAAADNGTDADAAETNACSSPAGAAAVAKAVGTDRVSCTDQAVDMDEASDVDGVFGPVNLDDVSDVMPGGPAAKAGIVQGASVFSVGFIVPPPVGSGVFVFGLKGGFWEVLCICASCASSQ